MKKTARKAISALLAAAICLGISCTALAAEPEPEKEEEFRGVWIASVANTNWPSKKGLTATEQKAEYGKLMDEVEAMNLNAVVVQIRPTADAFYPSKLNPWSEYLSGKQGKDPGYDPLAYMIQESHGRDLEFHAWFNPFRVSTSTAKKDWADLSVMKTHPEWVVSYGGTLWLNPGLPEVREYALASIMEVVKNYDIDAVHFDDYFYPYPSGKAEFPDWTQYKLYRDGVSDIYDWRRDNINFFIRDVSAAIKKEKPGVKFGVSPLGVWRSKSEDENGSDTTAKGSYDTIYADTVLWMKKGWLDYVAPQIYWDFEFEPAPYKKVLDFWVKQAEAYPNVHLYIGQGVYKIGSKGSWSNPEEMPKQLTLNRSVDAVKGVILYNIHSLIKNPLSIKDILVDEFYKKAASIPGMPWLEASPDIP